MTEEAIDDVYDFERYMHFTLGNPIAASRFEKNIKREINTLVTFPPKHSATGIFYRGYMIHKRVYKSYLLFYIINHDEKEVYLLRILKDLMDWESHLRTVSTYHIVR